MRHSMLFTFVLTIVAGLSQSGCQFLPNALQPDQLWKMNRNPAHDVGYSPDSRVEPMFAVADRPARMELADN